MCQRESIDRSAPEGALQRTGSDDLSQPQRLQEAEDAKAKAGGDAGDSPEGGGAPGSPEPSSLCTSSKSLSSSSSSSSLAFPISPDNPILRVASPLLEGRGKSGGSSPSSSSSEATNHGESEDQGPSQEPAQAQAQAQAEGEQTLLAAPQLDEGSFDFDLHAKEVAALQVALKSARLRAANTKAEQETKSQEVMRLQVALRDARVRVMPGGATPPLMVPAAHPSGPGGSSREQLSPPFHSPQHFREGTLAVRRSWPDLATGGGGSPHLRSGDHHHHHLLHSLPSGLPRSPSSTPSFAATSTYGETSALAQPQAQAQPPHRHHHQPPSAATALYSPGRPSRNGSAEQAAAAARRFSGTPPAPGRFEGGSYPPVSPSRPGSSPTSSPSAANTSPPPGTTTTTLFAYSNGSSPTAQGQGSRYSPTAGGGNRAQHHLHHHHQEGPSDHVGGGHVSPGHGAGRSSSSSSMQPYIPSSSFMSTGHYPVPPGGGQRQRPSKLLVPVYGGGQQQEPPPEKAPSLQGSSGVDPSIDPSVDTGLTQASLPVSVMPTGHGLVAFGNGSHHAGSPPPPPAPAAHSPQSPSFRPPPAGALTRPPPRRSLQQLFAEGGGSGDAGPAAGAGGMLPCSPPSPGFGPPSPSSPLPLLSRSRLAHHRSLPGRLSAVDSWTPPMPPGSMYNSSAAPRTPNGRLVHSVSQSPLSPFDAAAVAASPPPSHSMPGTPKDFAGLAEPGSPTRSTAAHSTADMTSVAGHSVAGSAISHLTQSRIKAWSSDRNGAEGAPGGNGARGGLGRSPPQARVAGGHTGNSNGSSGGSGTMVLHGGASSGEGEVEGGSAAGVVDLQEFSRLVAEMRGGGEQVRKLKTQTQLLVGWYQEARAAADERSWRALEASLRADYADQRAQRRQRELRELDAELSGLKDRLAGMEMLELENRALHQRVMALVTHRGPKLLIESASSAPRLGLPDKLPGSSTRSPGKQQQQQHDQHHHQHYHQLAAPGDTWQQSPSSPTQLQDGARAAAPGGGDVEALSQWMREVAQEGGHVEKLRKLNKLLQGWYAEANARAHDGITLAKEEEQRAREAHEVGAVACQLVHELEGKLAHMQRCVARRQNLEHINKELHQKVAAMTAGGAHVVPLEQQQEALLRCLGSNLGFDKGRPVAACAVYKCMVHWNVVQAQRSSIYDRVVDAVLAESREASAPTLCYWLANAATLHFLNTRGPNRTDTMVARRSIGLLVEKLYAALRSAMKAELLALVHACLQPSKAGDGAPKAGEQPDGDAIKHQAGVFWNDVLASLRQCLETMRAHFVPAYVAHELLQQLLSFLDGKILNCFMAHSVWCPSSLSNGETMEAGLALLDDWLAKVDSWAAAAHASSAPLQPNLSDSLRFIRQAFMLLTVARKPEKTLEQIEELCPDLSAAQLAHLCTWYEDDRGGVTGVSPAVIVQLWDKMNEESPFLVKEDKSIPFTADDVARSMKEFDLESIEPPAELANDKAFYFLLPMALSDRVPSAASRRITM